MQYAPIALFTYNRADHTKQAVESLLKNVEAKDSDLFIFSDGPKNEKAKKGVEENREYIRSLKNENDLEISQSRDTENAHSLVSLVNYHKENKFLQDNSSIPSDDSQSASLRKEPSASDDATQSNTPSLNREGRGESFKSVTIIEREKNWGLANSLIAGITEIVNKYGRVIVVEDDLILSPYFLQFMNEALEKYKDVDRVSAICSFTNPVTEPLPQTFFLRYFACWGWATWKKGWDLFEKDSRKLLWRLRNTWRVNEFNIENSYNFYNMLYCQMLGEIDSWAIRFYASSFVNNKLILYPGKSLCAQTGIDGSGTHAGSINNMQVEMTASPITIPEDIKVEENQDAFGVYSRFYRGQWNFHTPYNIFKYFVRRLIGIDFWQNK